MNLSEYLCVWERRERKGEGRKGERKGKEGKGERERDGGVLF